MSEMVIILSKVVPHRLFLLTLEPINNNIPAARVMSEHRSHHLVYGTLNDYLTGEELTDTDDERIRQDLSRLLVEKRGYQRQDLQPRLFIETLFTKNFVRSTIDITVTIEGRQVMIIRYGPGSLVSRERAALAAARVLNSSYRIPLAVVTNGRDALLLDSLTGNILKEGMGSILSKQELLTLLPTLTFADPQDQEKQLREKRILNAFDLERCCIGI